MNLDELKRVWSAHAEQLRKVSSANKYLVRESIVGKVRSAFFPSMIVQVLEILLGVVFMVASMYVLSEHWRETRYLIYGGVVLAASLVVTVLTLYSLYRIINIDYSASVLSLQKQIHRIRMAEYQALKWGMLLGMVVWLPMGLVLIEATTGVQLISQAPQAWLLMNVLLGFICLGAGHWLSCRFVEQADPNSWSGVIMQSLSGRGTQRALEQLKRLEQYTED